MNTEDARKYFSNDRYAVQLTGIEILEAGEHYAKCQLKIEDRHLGARNHVMGGTIFTLADFAFAVATNSEEVFTMTASSNITYFHQPKDQLLIAECTAIHAGRRAGFYETVVTDGMGTLVAKVSVTGITVSGK